MKNPFRYFKTSPEVIRLAVMMYVRFPLSLRNVEDLLHERDVDISHETVRYWWTRFGPTFAAAIRRKRVQRFGSRWQWHLDEMFVKTMEIPSTSGARSIMKAKCLRLTSLSPGIVTLRCTSYGKL